MGGQQRGTGKKLIAWVRWVTDANGVGPGYCKSCKASRRSPDSCAECPEPQILPVNDGAIDLYLLCQTQWARNYDGRRTGLNYAGVDVVMQRCSLRDNVDPELFFGLQVIEREIICVDMERE